MTRAIIQLPDFDPLAALSLGAWPPATWAKARPLALRQTWHSAPESGLQPARVWLATTKDRFVVLAELEDHDIMTSARRHNDPLWDLGDVLEIFLRHTGRPEYYEFHVAPNGVTLDLRYPRFYASRASGIAPYLLDQPHFSAWVQCDPIVNRWRVAATIPAANLVPANILGTETEWQFSFSRYDCGPDRSPIFSSTSPHPVLGFHRVEDWLHFRAPAFSSPD
jgi:hypothetical protein